MQFGLIRATFWHCHLQGGWIYTDLAFSSFSLPFQTPICAEEVTVTDATLRLP